MKRIKLILAFILIIVFWFSFDVFWFINFKKLYESEFNNKIIDTRQAGRSGKQIKIETENEYISLYAENEEYFNIGDSISKKSKSTEIKIFKRKNNKWNYFKSTYIQKDLNFYSFIVDEKNNNK